MKRTITAETTAWIPGHVDPEILLEDPVRIVDSLGYTEHEMRCWTKVGKATITIEVGSEDEILQAAVTALEAQKTAVLSAAQCKVAEIEDRISKLQALTYEPGTAGAAA